MYRHASVNRIYRLVWSYSSSSWVPAAETTRGRGKGSFKALLVGALFLGTGFAEAGPQGGRVVTGSGQIGQSGALTTITQTSAVLSLSWTSFNIASQETVDFVQPSTSSIAVNRITGANGTQIFGHLNANGQVYLINPNGVLFGRGSQVNVGGLVASTLEINDANLSATTRAFSGAGSGSVLNLGAIDANGNGNGGGYVALLGSHVGNQGAISAQLGTVALGAGSAATLTFQGDSLVHLQVDRSVLNSVATNGGLIRADGGQVLMTAGAKDTLLASVVNNTGVIEARTVQEHAGTITLLGGMADGTVNVAGTLDASAPDGGNGGFIETSAAHVEVASSAKITTAAAAGLIGSWLIDPHDFTVAPSGGDITGTALAAELATTSEVVQSSGGGASGTGNVNINDPVSWSANTTMTLTAANNVNVNASITASGNNAGIVLNPNTGNGGDAASGSGTLTFKQGTAVNLSGTSPTVSVAGLSYIVINTLGIAADATTAPANPSLQGMAATANLAGNYALGSNIDATATSSWNSGAGFIPIGTGAHPFAGNFTGLGHTISNLFIDLPTRSDVGLFGQAVFAKLIQNVGLVGGSVTGNNAVGELVGTSLDNINNSYATGAVSAGSSVGGLVGLAGYGYATINNSFATGAVAGASQVGGLVGNLNSHALVTGSFASGTVSAPANGALNIGGLVGSIGGFYGSSISNSHASGNVTVGAGSSNIGGLVGSIGAVYGSAIDKSYATGNVSVAGAGFNVGGLVGSIIGGNGSSLSNSYATGNVSVGNFSANVGGLVGINDTENSTPISNSYATGNVSAGTGSSNVGGLVGSNGYGGGYGFSASTISNSYATGNVSGGTNVGGLVGFNTAYGAINASYAKGAVSGSATVGGLVGANAGGAITSSYWNTTTSGQTTSAQTGGTNSGVGGLTTLQMQTAANFSGFTFSTVPGASGNSWVMVDVDGSLNNSGGAPGATFPMLTSEYSTVISNAHQLQLMAMALGANYSLAGNIDASATATAVANGSGDVWSTAGGFVAVGNASTPYAGTFDGLGYTVSNVNINRFYGSYLGLFGVAGPASIIQNVGLIGGTVQGANDVGALAGSDAGAINNTYATGAVIGTFSAQNYFVGGLVGISHGSIANSYTTGNTSGSGKLGGLVGASYGPITNSYATGTVGGEEGLGVGGLVGFNGSTISNSYASGNVSGQSSIGGLVGMNSGSITGSHASGTVSGNYGGGLVGQNLSTGSISNSYATGSVSGGGYSENIGGLVGSNSGLITKSYATGSVSGGGYSENIGGLVGLNSGSITTSYATGRVTGGGYSGGAGGLVGVNNAGGSINNSYATGSVYAPYNVEGGLVGTNAGSISTSYSIGSVWASGGGLVGSNSGSVTNSFWDITTSGLTSSSGGTGMVNSNMQLQANFTSATAANHNVNPGWDFVGTWFITSRGYPQLSGVNLRPLTITANNVNKIYNGTAFSGDSNGVTYSISGAASDFSGALTYTGTSQGVINVGGGTFTITPGGLQQTTNLYVVTYVSGTLRMSRLALTGSIATGSSVYGSALTPGAASFTDLVAGDVITPAVVTVNTTGHLSTSNHLNAGTYTSIESISSLGGVAAGDYTFAGIVGNYTVTPLPLTGSIATGSSVYGSSLAPGAVSFNNLVTGDVITPAVVTVNTVGHLSTSSHLNAGTYTSIESISSLGGAAAADYAFAGIVGNYSVTPLVLTGSIGTGSSVYGSALAPGAASFTNLVTGDIVAPGAVTVNTAGNLSTSNHLKAGSYTGIESVGTTLSGDDAPNYTFAGVTGDYSVSQLALTGSLGTGSSVYGSALMPGAASFTNLVTGDVVTPGSVIVTTAGNLSTSNHLKAGSYTGIESVGTTLSGDDAANYTFAGVTGDYSVGQLALMGSIAAGSSVYGSALTPGTATFTNLVTGDVVTSGSVIVTAAGNLSTSNHLKAGSYTGIESVGTTLSGDDAANYTFIGVTGDYSVSQLALTGSITAGSSVYGSALTPGTATFTNLVTGDLVAPGAVTVNTAGNLSTSNHLRAGSYAGIESVGATLSGDDAGNYTFTGVTGDYSVSQLALTGAIGTGSSVYGSALTPGAAIFTNLVTGDLVAPGAVTVNTAGNLSTSNHLKAGSYAGIESVGATLSGVDAGNYTFTGVTGDYSVSQLALTGAIGTGSSVYASTLTPGAAKFSNLVTGDLVAPGAVTVNTAGNLSTSNHLKAGSYTGIESVGTTLSGDDAANYTFIGVTGDYSVSQLALTGSITAGRSVYGSALNPGAAIFTNLVTGDLVAPGAVTVNTAGNLSTSNHLKAGTYTGIESVGTTLSGVDAGNYTFEGVTGNYSVNALPISVTAAGVNKIYDGTTLDAPTFSSSGTIPGDQMTLSATAASFVGKNVGAGQTITVSGITSSGADSPDYVLINSTATTTATIIPAQLTVTGVEAANKIYDGTTAVTLAGGNLVGQVASDAGQLSFTDVGSFSSKNVGTGIKVVAADSLSGAAAGNYVLVQPTGLIANISPAALTYDAIPASRIVGQSLEGLSGSVSGFVTGETQSNDTAGAVLWTTPADAGSRPGQYGIDGSGLTAANYTFVQAAANATALTLQPDAAPPPVSVVPTLSRGVTSAIASLQSMMLEVPPASPDSLLCTPGGAGGDHGCNLVSNSNGLSWRSEDSVADTQRTIGTTGGSLRVIGGGVRLPQ